MSLRLLTSRVIARASYMPVVRKSATMAVFRGYASKFFFFFFFLIEGKQTRFILIDISFMF